MPTLKLTGRYSPVIKVEGEDAVRNMHRFYMLSTCMPRFVGSRKQKWAGR